jgi:hypothetical protein
MAKAEHVIKRSFPGYQTADSKLTVTARYLIALVPKIVAGEIFRILSRECADVIDAGLPVS